VNSEPRSGNRAHELVSSKQGVNDMRSAVQQSLCIGLSLGLAACAGPHATEEQVPVDVEIASSEQALNLGLQLAQAFAGLPGAALALVDDRGVLWAGGVGYADLQTRRRVSADTPFWLASVSKTVTGAALVLAEERGLLSLDSDVRSLVARRAALDIATPAQGPITLRQLVSHTSAIRDSAFYACSYYVGSARGKHVTLVDALGPMLPPDLLPPDLHCDNDVAVDLGGFLRAYLARDGAYYTPDNFGSDGGFSYSNVGAALAGYALELQTGVSLADYARANLFAPLGMYNTSWRQGGSTLPEVATPYAWDDAQQQQIALPLYSLATWPDGALRSSARDMGRFLAMVMRGGELDGRRVLRAASVARMLTPISDNPEGHTAAFWQESEFEGDTLIGHDGSDPGATTLMWYQKQAKLGFVLLFNADSTQVAETVDPTLARDLFAAAARLHARRTR
jgi:CubicO group peptidase (beta-lactamase class C family)